MQPPTPIGNIRLAPPTAHRLPTPDASATAPAEDPSRRDGVVDGDGEVDDLVDGDRDRDDVCRLLGAAVSIEPFTA